MNTISHNTPGKRSPDGKFLEYAYTREIATRIVADLTDRGHNAQLLV
jgi:N-acetylmuramoyl-L-alanine amidase